MKIVLSILLVMLFVAFTAWSFRDLWNQNHGKNHDSFIELFEKSFEGGDESVAIVEKRRATIQAYIEKCCNSRESVLKLLKDTGFKVSTIETPNPQKLELSIQQLGVKHDGYSIFAERSPKAIQFWRIFTKYRISVYFQEGEIVYVSALVETSLP